MQKIGWDDVDHFNKNEKWGDPDMMHPVLIWLLNRARGVLGGEVSINGGYKTSGHAEHSFHYRGEAADFVVKGVDFFTAGLLLNEALPLGGLGVYPYWNTPGFHYDIGHTRAWIRNKQGVYQDYTRDELFKIFVSGDLSC